jgi:hypothetical protein
MFNLMRYDILMIAYDMIDLFFLSSLVYLLACLPVLYPLPSYQI